MTSSHAFCSKRLRIFSLLSCFWNMGARGTILYWPIQYTRSKAALILMSLRSMHITWLLTC